MKKFLCLFFSAMLFVCLYTGCGGGGGGAVQDSAAEAPMMMEENALAAKGTESQTVLPENRKWVITSDVRAETENLDQLLPSVMEQITGLQGYVEDQHIYNGSGTNKHRSVELTVRIPAQQADSFLNSLQEQSNVVYSSKNLQDITLQYVDTESRMQALKAEETRLLELMEKAETMSDLLEIEERLTDVRYEIENVTSRLRTYDNHVNYATIHLSIEEVREYTPVEEPGFLERISTGFMHNLRSVGQDIVDFVVLIIVSLPYLVVWIAVGLAVYFVIRFCRKHRKPRKPRNPSAPVQRPPMGNHFDPHTGMPLAPPMEKPQDPPEKEN